VSSQSNTRRWNVPRAERNPLLEDDRALAGAVEGEDHIACGACRLDNSSDALMALEVCPTVRTNSFAPPIITDQRPTSAAGRPGKRTSLVRGVATQCKIYRKGKPTMAPARDDDPFTPQEETPWLQGDTEL
jgi:hypothetical protein